MSTGGKANSQGEVSDYLTGVRDVSVIKQGLAGYKYGELNTAGHILILALSGRAALNLNGTDFTLMAGSAAWIIEAEWLRLSVLTAPWSYLQVHFTVNHIPAYSAEDRVKRLGQSILYISRELDKAWRMDARSAARTLLVHGLTSQLLGRLLQDAPAVHATPGARSSVWWKTESAARRNLARTYTLADLCALAGTNRVALEAAAREATGLTPIRRMHQIRLMHAQTLMRTTNLLLKEVAAASGYVRLHEFSRDYRKQFGLSPHKHRTRGYPEADRGKS